MSVKSIRLANILFEPEDKYAHLVNEAVLNEAVEDVQGYIETLDMLKNGLVGHANIKTMIEELHDELSSVADEKSGRLNQIFGKRKKFATATENLKTQIWDLYKKLALSSPLKAQFEESKRKLASKQLAIYVEIGRTGSATASTGSATASTPTGSAGVTIGEETTNAINTHLSSLGLTGPGADAEKNKIIDALNTILSSGTVLPEYRMRLAPFLFEADDETQSDSDNQGLKYENLFDQIFSKISDQSIKSQLQGKKEVFISKMMSSAETDSDSVDNNLSQNSVEPPEPPAIVGGGAEEAASSNNDSTDGAETNAKQKEAKNKLIRDVKFCRGELKRIQGEKVRLEQEIKQLKSNPIEFGKEGYDDYQSNLAIKDHDFKYEEGLERDAAVALQNALALAAAAGIRQDEIDAGTVSELRTRLRKLIIQEMYSLSLQDLFENDFNHFKSKSNFLEEAAGTGTIPSISPKKKFVNFKIEDFNDLETEPVGSDLLIAYDNTGTDEEEYDFSALGIQGIDKISIPKDLDAFYIVGSDNSNKPAALPDRFSSESGSKTPDKTLNDLDTGLGKTKSAIDKSQSTINDLVAKKAGLTNIGSTGLQTDFAKLKMLQFTSNYKLLEKMMTSPLPSATGGSSAATAAIAAGAAAVGAAAAGGGAGGSSGGGGAPGNAGKAQSAGQAGRHNLKNTLSGVPGVNDSNIEIIKTRINPLAGNIFNESVSYDQDRWGLLAGIRRKN